MESIDIQNRSFVVRWLKCSVNDVINYQIKPLKKSIDVSIYKKVTNNNEDNEQGNIYNEHISGNMSNPNIHIINDIKDAYNKPITPTTNSSQVKKDDSIHKPSDNNNISSRDHSGSTVSAFSNNDSNSSLNELNQSNASRPRRSLSLNNITHQSKTLSLSEKLTKEGYTLVKNIGHVQGNFLVQDSIKVVTKSTNKDFYFIFVFNNTLSKNIKKKILFNMSLQSVKKEKFVPISSPVIPIDSRTSLTGKQTLNQAGSTLNSEIAITVGQGRYLQGYLLKKRRKRLQGFKKRFFSLDFKYGTLSYYMNDHNQSFRGEILVNLSTVSANKKDKLIIIDSGMEIWALKATSLTSWEAWVTAFQSCFENEKKQTDITMRDASKRDSRTEKVSDLHDYERCEFNTRLRNQNIKHERALNQASIVRDNLLWKQVTEIKDRLGKCKNDSKLYVKIKDNDPKISNKDKTNNLFQDIQKIESLVNKLVEDIRDHDLNFNETIQRRSSIETNKSSVSLDKLSAISAFSDDVFFDAEDIGNRVIMLPDEQIEMDHEIPIKSTDLTKHNSKYGDDEDEDDEEDEDEDTDVNKYNQDSLSDEDSIREHSELFSFNAVGSSQKKDSINSEDNLYPLPLKKKINRRNDISISSTSPPSLLSFLRKNVGKDLSSVAMPISANEPHSILQTLAESFEYADILSNISTTDSTFQPLSIVSAFAVSALSIYRDKTRVLRKPFNPLLGETFEYISDTKQFRLISEKVSHKPQIFVFHVEHKDWECNYTVSPVQTFWGKSVELNNEGIVKLELKNSGEVLEWAQPTAMLKNLLAGEKYIEPINEFKILSSKGGYAKVLFRGSSMFGGRSEELTATIVPSSKDPNYSKETITGKWTESLVDKRSNEFLWKVEELLSDSKKKYGFTKFAANLNEITTIEEGFLPPTDSRLRPDMRAYENGELDKAETLKLELEKIQRDRRTDRNDVKPKFFKKISEKEWAFIQGEDSYWERRKRGDWSGIDALW
ncbi:hypothetical protein TPHA_0E01090 [Tetrapisispora phaffii CBS 4417]|uniref:PH domain-containing protein n=1 Tax=Tetrapisispora phaffii (strain ATCC 24235 / CBS 4417 / NBRC 1672 / NRRL Y-8282 / UCD 70-5) TaxID=1071381 RepID=G8BTH5_TETPH|nr:hypothetical protein TPHA_0E01090 [Tetrapisispora phaffii CBS 4417]CCE63203.1 hypothetical protein TPHA_0E01090 [Tetrapisispora phaffii CBS 4417]